MNIFNWKVHFGALTKSGHYYKLWKNWSAGEDSHLCIWMFSRFLSWSCFHLKGIFLAHVLYLMNTFPSSSWHPMPYMYNVVLSYVSINFDLISNLHWCKKFLTFQNLYVDWSWNNQYYHFPFDTDFYCIAMVCGNVTCWTHDETMPLVAL
jgi:hypothetical protein